MALVVVAGSGASVVETKTYSTDPAVDLNSGNFEWQLTCLALFAYAGARLCFATGGMAWGIVKLCWPLVLLLSLFFASSLWSIAPDITIRRSVVVAGFAISLLHSVAALEPRVLLQALGLGASMLVIGSLFVSLVLPQYGTMMEGEYAGAFRGVFGHKNLFAKNMVACAVVLGCCAYATKGWRRKVYVALAGVALVLLVLAQSITALLAAVLLALIAVGRASWKRSTVDGTAFICLAVFVTGIALVLWLFFGTDGIFNLLGRDSTLTGRIGVWEFVGMYIADRFWLGYGYAAFWTNSIGELNLAILIRDWMPFHAHNGILEFWLQLGAVGVV
ncbi:MAG: O-antigen ligase family protein, partial [Haliea sp.]